ncbi:hypothetical protein F5H01DRAFT_191367 [Linnemannia elongata]|nr:hypothetical protein F5H01DRAFT_191367 [Linnemannia elongata]
MTPFITRLSLTTIQNLFLCITDAVSFTLHQKRALRLSRLWVVIASVQLTNHSRSPFALAVSSCPLPPLYSLGFSSSFSLSASLFPLFPPLFLHSFHSNAPLLTIQSFLHCLLNNSSFTHTFSYFTLSIICTVCLSPLRLPPSRQLFLAPNSPFTRNTYNKHLTLW